MKNPAQLLTFVCANSNHERVLWWKISNIPKTVYTFPLESEDGIWIDHRRAPMSSDPQPVSFSAPEPEQLAPSFPGYCIESLIATGGMGAVYKAIQVSLDRPVAIKILPREISADPSFRDSFTAEAKAMAPAEPPESHRGL